MSEKQFPKDFVCEMQDLLGAEGAMSLLCALEGKASVSIRRHPLKWSSGVEKVWRNEVLHQDEAEEDARGGALEKVAWCDAGYYLSERPQFTLDPLFHAGAYYVQEASSMFVEQLYRALPEAPQRMLDLCAAPGGKSTHWRALLPEESLLVANEPIRNRAMVLAENMAKWGYANTVVTNAYPADFAPMGAMFDVIAADVPCSGEGMFRKDDQAVSEWSLDAVAMCAERQRGIVRDVWPALKEGGHFIYSTCTFNRLENEENIAYICEVLGAEVVEVSVPTEWQVEGDLSGQGESVFHFLPSKTRGEGLFCCLLRKTARAKAPKKWKQQKERFAVGETKKLLEGLREGERYRVFSVDGTYVSAVRKTYYEDVLRLSSGLRVLRAGVELAEQKGKKWQSRTELALSTALNREAFAYVELSLEDALKYLHREVLQIDAPKGYVLVGYQNLPLGFVNNLGTRANNLYPSEWRIRKDVN